MYLVCLTKKRLKKEIKSFYLLLLLCAAARRTGHPDEIQRRQLMLKKEQVVIFTYGMGEDAHRYDDAFSRVMKLLEVYVDTGIDHVTLP